MEEEKLTDRCAFCAKSTYYLYLTDRPRVHNKNYFFFIKTHFFLPKGAIDRMQFGLVNHMYTNSAMQQDEPKVDTGPAWFADVTAASGIDFVGDPVISMAAAFSQSVGSGAAPYDF